MPGPVAGKLASCGCGSRLAGEALLGLSSWLAREGGRGALAFLSSEAAFSGTLVPGPQASPLGSYQGSCGGGPGLDGGTPFFSIVLTPGVLAFPWTRGSGQAAALTQLSRVTLGSHLSLLSLSFLIGKTVGLD